MLSLEIALLLISVPGQEAIKVQDSGIIDVCPWYCTKQVTKLKAKSKFKPQQPVFQDLVSIKFWSYFIPKTFRATCCPIRLICVTVNTVFYGKSSRTSNKFRYRKTVNLPCLPQVTFLNGLQSATCRHLPVLRTTPQNFKYFCLSPSFWSKIFTERIWDTV
jgi:hypothetical protein